MSNVSPFTQTSVANQAQYRYNQASHPLPFMKASQVVAPKRAPTKEKPDLEEALEESDDEVLVDVEKADDEDEDVDLSKDKYVKQPKKKKAPAKANGSNKRKKKDMDDEDDEEESEKPKKGKGKAKAKK